MRRFIPLSVLLMTGAGFSAASAQRSAVTAHGTVRDSVSGGPIPGAVVMLQDSAGQTLARTVTDEHGAYAVLAPASTRAIRLLRLGFRPRQVSLPVTMRASDTLAIAMVPVPTMLEPTVSSANATCPHSRTREAAFGLLEQARAALLSIVVARETNPARLVLLKYTRTYDRYNGRITNQDVRIDSLAAATTSFVAPRSAVDVGRFGFTRDSGTTTLFMGVDADVLLDPHFAETYCVDLHEPDRERAGQVGLEFSAAHGRPGRVDIEGTLWIDTLARSLKDIEYRYVGVDRAAHPKRPDGQTYFHEMANGVVLVDRWWLRSPVMWSSGASETAEVDPSGSLRPGLPRPRIDIVETGGVLANATWPQGVSWHAALGTLRVRGMNQSGELEPDTKAHLLGTDYFGVSDSTGSFEIPSLVPGPYALTIIDPALARIGAEIPTTFQFVEAGDSTIEQSLRLPTVKEYVAQRCRAARHFDESASVYLFGRLTTRDGKPVDDAEISVLRVLEPGNSHAIQSRMRTDAGGYFQFCDADLDDGDAVMLRAKAGKRTVMDRQLKVVAGVNVIGWALGPTP